jgi:hypothetical protein
MDPVIKPVKRCLICHSSLHCDRIWRDRDVIAGPAAVQSRRMHDRGEHDQPVSMTKKAEKLAANSPKAWHGTLGDDRIAYHCGCDGNEPDVSRSRVTSQWCKALPWSDEPLNATGIVAAPLLEGEDLLWGDPLLLIRADVKGW